MKNRSKFKAPSPANTLTICIKLASGCLD